MRKLSFLGLLVSLVLVSTPVVQSQEAASKSMHYVIDFKRLSYYLELDDCQKGEVYEINSFFIEQQEAYLSGNMSPEVLEKNWNYVLYSNLKLMKAALTDKQYAKYLRVLNLTENNRMFAASVKTENNDAGLVVMVSSK